MKFFKKILEWFSPLPEIKKIETKVEEPKIPDTLNNLPSVISSETPETPTKKAPKKSVAKSTGTKPKKKRYYGKPKPKSDNKQ